MHGKMIPVFEQIRLILNKQFRFSLDQIQPETEFERELGTDSREFFELIDEFEIAFNIEINIEEATTFVTIQDAINYIEKKRINHDQIELP